ncbi:MAG: M23 family metallopeptidase [Euryarchaeota archaeon]|nr:M23 family metallopeptidase [Euryarchaeota archaeon]
MKKIASHGEIDLFAPDNSRFSFLKSPYAAHKTHSAVDIYYGDFGSEALSPVDGEVIDVRSFDTPTPFKDWDSKEYVIAIRQNDHVIKILHVKPDVSPGDAVSKGDSIGTFIYNGYFIFWNDPVMHVEVRKTGDYLRASNNMRLTPNIEWSRLPSSKTLDIECLVEETNKRYSVLSSHYHKCGDVGGFAMDCGFLDGYVPYSDDGFFGIVKPDGFFHPQVSLEVTKDNSEIKCSGIAFRLSFIEPKIKLIPLKYGDRLVEAGEKVRIRLGFR